MEEREVSERGRRVLAILTEVRRTATWLQTQRENPVVGGRSDLVWLWRRPQCFAAILPLVGFEIETSWRTRKHLRGDYLTLLELWPAAYAS